MACEREIQAAVAQFLNFALPADAMFHHSPMEGKRGWKAQADLKSSGAQAGFPDIVILWQGRAFTIELKAPKKYLSPVQKVAHRRLEKAGIPIRVCHSVTEVAMTLADWSIPLSARVAA
jgi:hypothetical protein